MTSIAGNLHGRLLAAVAALVAGVSCSDDPVVDARAVLEATPDTLDFGPTFVGGRSSLEVEIRSNGRTPIRIWITDAVDSFSVEPPSLEIPAGGTGRLEVFFAPVAIGRAGGRLVLGDGDSRVVLEVSGSGVERVVEVPALLDLGGVPVGRTGEAAVRLVNRSVLPVTLGVEVSGERAFAPADSVVELPPGGTEEFLVRFTPEVRGPARGTLHLWPCPGCEPLEVELRGRGLADQMTSFPRALDFGAVIVGGSRTLALDLENHGDVTHTVAELRVQPEEHFAVGGASLPAEVAPGGHLDLEVTFAPRSGGALAATLRALDPDGFPVIEVSLSGLGQESTLLVEPEAVDFGVGAVGASYRRTVRVAVEGGPVEVEGLAMEGDTAAFEVRAHRGPPAVVGEPLDLTVTFAPRIAGATGATAVVKTNHPLHPELRIPLSGTGTVQGPCRVAVSPAELGFGLVTAGTTGRATLAVKNTGTGDCVLDGFAIGAEAEPFSLGPVDAPVTVEPGSTWELEVVYAPPADHRGESRGRLTFDTNDDRFPVMAVWLVGFAFEGVLTALPDPVDFGAVPVNHPAYRQVEFRNEGVTTLRVTNVLVPLGTSPAFSVEVRPPLPADLAPGAGIAVGVGFRPGTEGTFAGVVEAQVEGTAGGKRAALRGQGTPEPCGDACHAPVPLCPGALRTEVTKTVRLEGAALDPDGANPACTWSLLSAPEGSLATGTPISPCDLDFTPDVEGDYVFELVARDEAGLEGSCLAEVRADPYSGLWIETRWDVEADVDLHLLHPTRYPGIDPFDAWSWAGTDGADCFYWSCLQDDGGLSWDDPGPGDDPSLDVDSQERGPENIRIEVPSREHPYWIGVHWLHDPAGHAEVRVTTKVHCGTVQVANETVTLLHREHAVLGAVEVDPDGTCTFTPSDVRLGY